MAAFTSKATGNWSSSGQTTWNEVGVPGNGDTVSIGAHTITVDVNTTVGSSPNNNTTKVVDLTNANSILIVAAGVTLTVKGNIGHVNGSTHTQQAGSTVTFDNSGSGGSPVYTFINGGFSKFNFNGSSGNAATIQAISGQTFGMGVALSQFVATYALFRRASNLTCTNLNATTYTISDSSFDACTRLNITSTLGTVTFILDRNTFANGTHATDDIVLTMATTRASGTRRIYGNTFTKTFNYSTSVDFTITNNYFGFGLNPNASGKWTTFSLNLFRHDGTLNGGNGALIPWSIERNYIVVENAVGNPHFLSATSKLGADNTISQNIFEGYTPDGSQPDSGDCIIMINTSGASSNKVIGKNNIILPSSYPAVTVMSGSLLTLYNADSTALSEWYRNTGNIDKTTGAAGRLGMLDVAEAGNGVAGQVGVLKSNVAWGRSSGQGYLATRIQGNVKDIITAAGADYNWTYNVTAGDNQRGYEDYAASNTLWTAGDAVAASVDVHQGSGNPNFYDPTRNIAAWATARGYGAGDYAAGLAALQAAPSTRIPDLINYVFEGFRPGNSSMRSAAHDGGCVGAANYYKSTRTMVRVTSHRASLAKFGL